MSFQGFILGIWKTNAPTVGIKDHIILEGPGTFVIPQLLPASEGYQHKEQVKKWGTKETDFH